MAKLAKSQARLATSVTIRAVKNDISIDNLSSLEQVNQNSLKVGAILEFTEDATRGTDPRYELDADLAGDMVERIPHVIENRTIRVNRAVLYESDIFAAFGLSATDILEQNVPFVVVKVEKSPEGSPVPATTTIYTGCWFHNSPKTYNIGAGDIKVMQAVDIGYTKKYVS